MPLARDTGQLFGALVGRGDRRGCSCVLILTAVVGVLAVVLLSPPLSAKAGTLTEKEENYLLFALERVPSSY